ncbi:MAG: Ig-like domain-containing protein, partial [Kofleriaceae bacterium]
MRSSFAFPLLVSAVLGACATSPPDPDLDSTDQPVWVNGDFENDPIGTTPPTGWTRQTYLNPGITDTRPTPQTLASLNLGAGGVAMSSVVGGAPESQTDPDIRTTGSLRFPKYGQRAAVVNYLSATSPGKDRNVNALRQTMTIGLGDVDPTDDKVHVRFAIAPVLENPPHAYHEQPYYFVRLHNATTGATLYQDFNASGQPGVPWKDFTSLAGNASQYTDWQLVDIAPGNAGLAVGDQVELLVVAGGCSLGGHWGRVYVDAVGSGIPGLFAWATGPQQVNAGDDITYTVHYKNGGTTTTTGTKLDLVTPPNTTFQATSLGAACTTPAVGATGTVSCSLGSLANGATGSFTIRVKVPAGTPNGTRITNGTYSIYATGISALIGPKVYTNVTSSVAYADVCVSVTDGLAAIGWGQPIRYTLQVSNAGPMAAPVVVQDTLPPQLVNAAWTCASTGGATCTASGTGNLLQTVQLPAGGVATFTIDAQVVAGTGAGTLKNTVTATVGGGITDPDSTGNTAVDLTQIGTPRTLTVSKSGAPALGSISSTPSSLSCGLACTSASAEFLDGTQVVLTATPAPGSTFTGWGGACSGTATTCTVTMNGAQGVTAAFVGAPAAVVTGGDGQATPIGTPFGAPLTVTVVDASGAPIPNVTVSFAAPAGGASAMLGATTATTNSAGQVAITATANLTPGSYVVIATVPGIAGPIELALSNLGPPASIAIVGGNAQSTAVTTAFAAPLLVVVRDAVNQPLPNIAVAFTAPASGPSAALLATATTDAFGVALTTATANQRAGGYQVTAAIPAASVAFALTNLAGPAATVTVIGGGGQEAEVGSAFGDPIVVEVRDAFGNPVPGAAVDFGAPGSGPTAGFSPSPATTGPDGRATVTGTAGSTAGSYDVAISSGGATP